MAHLLDIIFALLVLVMVFVAAKRGIVLTVLDIAAGIISFLFAKLIAPRAATAIYDQHIKALILTFLGEKYAQMQNAIGNAANGILSVFDFLPKGVLEYANASGVINSDYVASAVMEKITTVAELEENIIAPVVISLLNILCFAIIAVALLVAFKIIARFLAKIITTAKIAKKLDTSLGAVCGLVKGCIYVFIIASLVSVIACSSPSLASYAADSYVCAAASKLIGL